MIMLKDDLAYVKDVISNYPEEQWGQIVYEKNSPLLWRHLSPQRNGLFGWLPVRQHDRILIVNSECGAWLSCFAEQGCQIVSVEDAVEQREIQRLRFGDYSNVSVISSNEFFQGYSKEKFDWIIVDQELADLAVYMKCLNCLGHLVLNVHNKMGLSHWNGNPYETGQTFACVNQDDTKDGMVGYTKGELQHMLQQLGFETPRFYYPYPDSICPEQIFSNDQMIAASDVKETINTQHQRMRLFDEKQVMNVLIRDGRFDYFFEDFIVVCQKEK